MHTLFLYVMPLMIASGPPPAPAKVPIPDAFICPITGEVRRGYTLLVPTFGPPKSWSFTSSRHQIMQDPVQTIDGHAYEREAIVAWFATVSVYDPAVILEGLHVCLQAVVHGHDLERWQSQQYGGRIRRALCGFESHSLSHSADNARLKASRLIS